MGNKYIYHGIDITLDIYEKICTVIELLSEKEGLLMNVIFCFQNPGYMSCSKM